ncbi:hypothetical protein DF186_14105, partial [Enterococcus hirae]
MARLRDKAEDRLLDATQKAIKSREPGVGFDLLQAALLIKPNSDRAWRGLKHVKVEGEWLRPRDAELRRKGIYAVGLSLLGMLVYIRFRFELRFGIGALVAVVHDILITLGLFALTGLEFNLTTVAGFLTLVGYSVN